MNPKGNNDYIQKSESPYLIQVRNELGIWVVGYLM